MIQLNEHLVNPDNICSVKRYYQITKTPGEPEKKDYFRMSIIYTFGKSESIEFESAEQMDDAFEKLKNL